MVWPAGHTIWCYSEFWDIKLAKSSECACTPSCSHVAETSHLWSVLTGGSCRPSSWLVSSRNDLITSLLQTWRSHFLQCSALWTVVVSLCFFRESWGSSEKSAPALLWPRYLPSAENSYGRYERTTQGDTASAEFPPIRLLIVASCSKHKMCGNRAACFLAVLFLYHLMTRVNDPGSCLLCKQVKLQKQRQRCW